MEKKFVSKELNSQLIRTVNSSRSQDFCVFFIQKTNSYLVWRQKNDHNCLKDPNVEWSSLRRPEKLNKVQCQKIFYIRILGIDRSSQFAEIALKWAYSHHQPNYTTDRFFTAGKKTL